MEHGDLGAIKLTTQNSIELMGVYPNWEGVKS